MKNTRRQTKMREETIRVANIWAKQQLLNEGLCVGSLVQTGYTPLIGVEGRVVKINPTKVKVLFLEFGDYRVSTLPFNYIKLIK